MTNNEDIWPTVGRSWSIPHTTPALHLYLIPSIVTHLALQEHNKAHYMAVTQRQSIFHVLPNN